MAANRSAREMKPRTMPIPTKTRRPCKPLSRPRAGRTPSSRFRAKPLLPRTADRNLRLRVRSGPRPGRCSLARHPDPVGRDRHRTRGAALHGRSRPPRSRFDRRHVGLAGQVLPRPQPQPRRDRLLSRSLVGGGLPGGRPALRVPGRRDRRPRRERRRLGRGLACPLIRRREHPPPSAPLRPRRGGAGRPLDAPWLLPPQSTEHLYGTADGGDDGRGAEAGEGSGGTVKSCVAAAPR